MREYPKIGEVERRPKNTSQLCARPGCGKIAQWKVFIQVNWFRGDDEARWACDEDKRDVNGLLEGNVK